MSVVRKVKAFIHRGNYRSPKERFFAKACIELGMSFKYQPEKYQTPFGGYIPDFYLPRHDLYVEVYSGSYSFERAQAIGAFRRSHTLKVVRSQNRKEVIKWLLKTV